LRWPGPHRRAFRAAVAAAFDSAGGTRRYAGAPVSVAAPRPGALQFYDPHAQVGLTARIDSAGGRTAARLLLFLDRRRLTLFIGEDSCGSPASGGGLHILPEGDGFRLRFDRTALSCDDGTLYVDLDRAFAASPRCAVPVH